MVVAPKSSREVRICVDLTRFNKSMKKENHSIPRDTGTGTTGGKPEILKKLMSSIQKNAFWYISGNRILSETKQQYPRRFRGSYLYDG